MRLRAIARDPDVVRWSHTLLVGEPVLSKVSPIMKQLCVAALLACVALGIGSPLAYAQTMYDCQTVAKPKDRLACYDNLSPPVAAGAKRKTATSTTTDLEKEDARMKQLLRPICKNC